MDSAGLADCAGLCRFTAGVKRTCQQSICLFAQQLDIFQFVLLRYSKVLTAFCLALPCFGSGSRKSSMTPGGSGLADAAGAPNASRLPKFCAH
jgi:hypothetical protein